MLKSFQCSREVSKFHIHRFFFLHHTHNFVLMAIFSVIHRKVPSPHVAFTAISAAIVFNLELEYLFFGISLSLFLHLPNFLFIIPLYVYHFLFYLFKYLINLLDIIFKCDNFFYFNQSE